MPKISVSLKDILFIIVGILEEVIQINQQCGGIYDG